MTINLLEFINIIFYLVLIILIVVLIILGIRTIHTLDKVDKIVDDIAVKSSKLNGVFNFIDGATDVVAGFSDSIVNLLSAGIEKVVNRKKGKKDE